MTQSTEQFIQSWGRLRKLGRRRYILFRGIMFYGGMTALIFILLNAVWTNVENGRSVLDADGLEIFDLAYLVLIFTFVIVAAGYAWGAFTWRHNEKTWLQFVQEKGG